MTRFLLVTLGLGLGVAAHVTGERAAQARNAEANAPSSMQEKCSFSKIGASPATAAISGLVLPSPSGYCSVKNVGTPTSCAAVMRSAAFLSVLAGANIAGTRRSCMSITTNTESGARISNVIPGLNKH